MSARDRIMSLAARISAGLAADWHGEMRQHMDAHRVDNREEAAAWFANYPWTADDSDWARGRNDALAWVVSILRNPNPQRPEPQLPACVHCGNTTGPWQPTDGHYPSGAQVLECTGGCAATPDTLANWLYLRFSKSAAPWEDVDLVDRTYWEHEAQAVRRAVARGGFRAASTEEKANTPTTPTDTNRRARLLHEMALGARWKSGDVARWYETQGLTGLGVRAARHDLAVLRDSGAITQHDEKGVRFYVLASRKDHT